MIQDFFLNPNIDKYDLSSIRRLSGGGAAMPAAVAQRLQSVGVTYVEGYGLTETIGGDAHQSSGACQAAVSWNSDLRYRVPRGRSGYFAGNCRRAKSARSSCTVRRCSWATGTNRRHPAQVFVEIDGKRFFRSGDLGRMDEDGYFFIVDRLKRMINASGYKVWPTGS